MRNRCDLVSFRRLHENDNGRIRREKQRSGPRLYFPIGEYEELLQDLDDLAVIAVSKNEPTILAEVKRRLKKNGALRR